MEALIQKLHEEVDEFLDNPNVEEVADILEVLHAICILKNTNLQTLEKVHVRKKRKNVEVLSKG